MSKVCIYARVSSEEQNEDQQIADLKRAAELRGFDVVSVVQERITTRKKERPGFEKVLALARSRKIDVVMVWKYDRLARSTSELIRSAEEFRSLGIDFISLQDGTDTSTPHGRMFFTILAGFAEFERDMLSIRIRSGIRRVKEKEARTGEVATRSGNPIGRPAIPDSVKQNAILLKEKGVRPAEIQRRLNISKKSYYRITG